MFSIDWLVFAWKYGRTYWRELALMLLITVVSIGLVRYKTAVERRAVLAHELHVADSTLGILRPQLDSANAKLERDASATDSALQAWQAVANAANNTPEIIHVPGRVDTLHHHDTTFVAATSTAPTREEILQAGNNLAQACQDQANSCAEAKAAAARVIAALTQENTALKAGAPIAASRSCTEPVILGVLAGALGGYSAGKRWKVTLGSVSIPIP